MSSKVNMQFALEFNLMNSFATVTHVEMSKTRNRIAIQRP